MSEKERSAVWNHKKPAGMVMRSLKFWGLYTIEGIGIAVGMGLLLYFYLLIQMPEGLVKGFFENLALYPYYLLVAGSFYMMMYVMSCFQVYYSLLVSMNVTRKAVVLGIVASTGIVVAALSLIMWVIWKLVPGAVSRSGLGNFHLFSGILFLVTGVMLLLGAVIVKWGKIGTIVTMLIAGIGGGCMGASVAMMGEDMIEILLKIAEHNFVIVFVIGVAVFAAAGSFIMAVSRKLEVRR